MAETSGFDHQKATKYFRFNRFWMKVAGFLPWFPDRSNALKVTVNFVYFMAFLLLISLITVLSFTNGVVSWNGDILALIPDLFVAAIYLMTFTIFVYFRCNEKATYELMNYVNQNFKFHSARGLSSMTMARSCKMAQVLSISYSVGGLIGSQYWTILPLFTPTINGTRLLPLDLWYPIDVQRSTCYELAYIMQFLGQTMISACYTGFAGFYVANCVLICGQLDLLCCSLRNIKYTAILRSGASYDQIKHFMVDILVDEKRLYFCGEADFQDTTFDYEEVVSLAQTRIEGVTELTNDDFCSTTFDTHTLAAVKDCLRFHDMIAKHIRMFESLSSPLFFFKIAASTFHVCLLLYALNEIVTFKSLDYAVLSIVDLFLYCFMANQVSLEYDKVIGSAYASAWCTYDKTSARTLYTFMVTVSQTRKLQVLGFYDVLLTSFITILKASFSYFTVLSTLKDKETE